MVPNGIMYKVFHPVRSRSQDMGQQEMLLISLSKPRFSESSLGASNTLHLCCKNKPPRHHGPSLTSLHHHPEIQPGTISGQSAENQHSIDTKNPRKGEKRCSCQCYLRQKVALILLHLLIHKAVVLLLNQLQNTALLLMLTLIY